MDARTLKIATATSLAALFTGCATLESSPTSRSPEAIRAEAAKLNAQTPAVKELHAAEEEYVKAGVDYYKRTGALPPGVSQDSCLIAQRGSSIGAGVGAAGGALIGSQTAGKNNRGNATAAGALIGAITGKILYDADAAAKLALNCRVLQGIAAASGGKVQVQGANINPNMRGHGGGQGGNPFGTPAFPVRPFQVR
jgi:hypothetical protein